MEYIVKQYSETDYDEVVSLWEKTGMGGAFRGDSKEIIQSTLDKGGELFVLVENKAGKIVGSSWITNDGRRLYLHHFGILPEYQGRGLSHHLMKASLDVTKKLKLQIKLEVHEKNIVALNLYQKYGFRYLGDYDLYIIRDIESI